MIFIVSGLGFSLSDFASLGIHGAMSLIIISQIILMIKAIDLIKQHVVPLASNHFKHVEDSFNRMSEKLDIQCNRDETISNILASQNDAIKSQSDLLRLHLKKHRKDEK